MEIFGIRRRVSAFVRDVLDVADLRNQVTQLHVQMAGVSVAALGGTAPENVATRFQYGWSVTYQDVLELRRKYEEMCRTMSGAPTPACPKCGSRAGVHLYGPANENYPASFVCSRESKEHYFTIIDLTGEERCLAMAANAYWVTRSKVNAGLL
jgi:hypothetical protein